jgi:hypothetical protein
MSRVRPRATPPHPRPLTEEEWIERELEKRPPRSEAWKAETRRLWGFREASGNPDDLNMVGIELSALPGTVDDDSKNVPA